ncbi:MAG TPA: penicillin-binding protein 2, partial [Alphaproteobacteria bacterium]|nr:penicillin-binding protein 2 [Alphaproteobacteria bacterium]
MAGDSERSRLFTRRAILIGAAQTSLFTLLAGRLYYLEIMQGENYKTLAEENRINLRLIAPRRGQILDQNGTPLAVNQQNYRVVLLPEQVDDIEDLINDLGAYVEIDATDRKRIERDLKNDVGNFNAILVKDNLTWSQVAQISLHNLDLPGTDIDTGEVRSYPYNEATSHLLGYVGTVSQEELNNSEDDDDNGDNILAIPGFRIGKNGVEKQYDLEMRGEAGNVQMEVNAHGRVVRELARNESKPGQDVMLTIDIGLQQFTQQRLLAEEGAAAVIIDIHTGAILALASQPGFDPNLFTYGIAQDDWDRLNNDIHAPLLNKVTSGVYAPGSTMKPIVAMAALEANMVNPEAKTYCPGYLDMGTYRFHCWKHGGHGYVNLHQAIAGSCDTYFYDLGKRIGIDRIESMAKRMGYGTKLGVDLPHERPGLVPSRAWKEATRGEPWQQGETLIAAIGQGYMLTSPLQLAVMAARVSNGGKAVIPHILKKIGDKVRPESQWPSLGFNADHMRIVQQGMSAVVNEQIGTAYAARIMKPEFAMAGKTGTSQVRHISTAERDSGVIKNEALPWKERDHALFGGFAPVDN